MLTRRLQIFLIIAFILLLMWLIRQVRKKSLDLKYTLSWLLLTVILLVLSLFPSLLDVFARWLGIYDPVNMIFFAGFVFTLIIIYTLTAAVSKQSAQIRKMAQEIALLKDLESKKKEAPGEKNCGEDREKEEQEIK